MTRPRRRINQTDGESMVRWNRWTTPRVVSKNCPQRERFPLLEFGISVVKEIELAIVVATGKRFNFSESKSVKWSWISVECDPDDYSVLATFLVNCNNFRRNGNHFTYDALRLFGCRN
jgi:hypothetical protein